MTRYTRWLWFLLPLGIVLGFERLVIGLLSALQEKGDLLGPRLFFWLPFLSALPPLLLLLVAWQRRRRCVGSRVPWFSRAALSSDIGWGVLTGLACLAVFVGSLQFMKLLGVPGPDFTRFQPEHHLYFTTLGALLPALAEELYFRGFLAERFSDLRLVLRSGLASAAFALWHVQSPSYLLHTFLIGVILALCVQRRGCLLPAIVAHGIANAGAGLLIVKGWA